MTERCTKDVQFSRLLAKLDAEYDRIIGSAPTTGDFSRLQEFEQILEANRWLMAERDKAVRRVGVLEGALRERDHVIELFQAAIRAHNRWCGYRGEAPGDAALNRALNAAADLTEPGAVLAGGEAGKEKP